METIGPDVLVYDIETFLPGHKPDAQKDRLRIFGCYSYKTNKTYLLTDKEQVQKIINAHRFLVGFNVLEYDNPILAREGIKFDYKIVIDLYKIFKMRAGVMMTEKGMLGNILMEYSLDYITKTVGVANDTDGKMDIDYNIFKKKAWTKEETNRVVEYTKKDIEITRKLYEWVENYFDSFKDFLMSEDVRKKAYLTASVAKFAYKSICKAMKWEEIYNTNFEELEESISGGYVAYPAGEKFEGDIYCLDFNSLYPMIMIMCNLYGRIKDSLMPAYDGNGVWELEGRYNNTEMAGVSKLLRKYYFMRMFYKRAVLIRSTKTVVKMKAIISNPEKYKGDEVYYVDERSDNLELMKRVIDDELIKIYRELVEQGVDKREYSIKIIINTIYGILNNQYYARVYDLVAGGDCTRVGRQWIKHARKVFNDNGYELIYSDTDSVYIKDPFHDKEKMLAVKDKIISDIKDSVPFPQAVFDMGIDDEIKYMFFFKGDRKKEDSEEDMDQFDHINKPKNLMKKNYIYVTKDNKLKIKNLGLRKKSNSELSKKIFWEHLVPKITSEGEVKFSKTYLKNLMLELLEQDLHLAVFRKEVGAFAQYEKSSPGSLPAQLAQKYGPGIHFVVPNTKGIGVGKSKKYCTVDEFKEQKMNIGHIDLEGVWKELDYFIKPVEEKTIFSF